MASSAPNKICLAGTPQHDEKLAANVAITPGMLVELASASTVRPHNAAGGNARPMWADVQPFTDPVDGTKSIDVNYGTADTVYLLETKAGDVIYALLAAGENVAAGAFLQSDGAGALEAFAGGTGTPAATVATANEAIDNSGGGTAVRIKVTSL